MLYIQEDYTNETEHCRFGSSEVYETCFETLSELYKSCLKEFGNCVSKVYQDDKEGHSKQIGWCFQKRVKYEDSKDTFLQSVWITVHTAPPVKSVKYNYFEF